MDKETGTTFPVSVQDKQDNTLLDTGAEKSCMSMDLFGRLELSLNALKVPKLRNASGRDMVTHGVMTVNFQMGKYNIFTRICSVQSLGMTNDYRMRLHSQQFYRYCLDKTGNEEDYAGQQIGH